MNPPQPTAEALAGISDGAKNNIAVISTVLTILRTVIYRPQTRAVAPAMGGQDN
jgi:hypothetical protein